jgi:hypothetical protein
MNEYDVLQRLKDELVSLTDKLDRLNKALEGGFVEATRMYGAAQASLMLVQRELTNSLQSVLAQRIEDLNTWHISPIYHGKEFTDEENKTEL